jgi:hypothetical protein
MDIEDNWPYDTITPREQGAIYDLLVALETQLDRLDVQLDELQEQRFIETATTYELEKLAAEVGTQRETGESDERLRFRTAIAKAVTRSDGTIDDIAAVLYVIFGDDVQNINIEASSSEPVVQLYMPSTLVEDVPLTLSELEHELENITPVGDGLQIVTDDTFRFGESDDQGLGRGELA